MLTERRGIMYVSENI